MCLEKGQVLIIGYYRLYSLYNYSFCQFPSQVSATKRTLENMIYTVKVFIILIRIKLIHYY